MKIMLMKNSNDNIGNQTREIPPQPTALWRAPLYEKYKVQPQIL